MKLFTNKYIRTLFCVILVSVIFFALISLFIIVTDNSVWWVLAAGLGMVGVVTCALLLYFKKQNSIIENAEQQIEKYLSGDNSARIECDTEGELYKLFHNINSLSAVLNAHAENEQKAKEFLKSTISDISHQLKTPLAALNIYNGIILQEAENSPEIQNFCTLSEHELNRINVLVQNLLTITRLDAGTILLEKKNENLSDIINEILMQFSFRVSSEGKEIKACGDDNIFLLCDRDWIKEALCNIVKNALDHTKHGDKITVEYKGFPSFVQIKIADNGSGIHPDDIHHIFKRFYRSRFSKDTDGLGLGLSLAKTIIELHGGSIEADSKFGVGTAFTLNF